STSASSHSHNGNQFMRFSIVSTRLEKAGVTELAEAMDISKSAVHRHLATLANRGRVRKIDGNYHSVSKETEQVQPTFEIIESLSRLDSATPAEIAEATEKSKDTVVEYLVQLEQAEYVVKQGDEYQNSLKFLDIGNASNTIPVFSTLSKRTTRQRK
ncbi:helix-turn-helix domain-containing protein, partial [Haladaptatus sp. W1]|uniref:helix-turn-helix domain-containing protein n=1 Tax=Haladaptatus sp. W1 TaxID=1897478 RepID=UPI001C30FC30